MSGSSDPSHPDHSEEPIVLFRTMIVGQIFCLFLNTGKVIFFHPLYFEQTYYRTQNANDRGFPTFGQRRFFTDQEHLFSEIR